MNIVEVANFGGPVFFRNEVRMAAPLGMESTPINEAQGNNIASAATVNLDTATGNLVDVTGTTTITSITLSQGRERTVRFTGALTLTHGASLVLPGSANITTAAGDFAVFRGYSGGVVRCVVYQRASGQSVVGAPSWPLVSQSSTLNPATINTYYLLSGASFTVTLPTAASVAGQGFVFHHNGTSISQVYTFNTTSGQTIGGVSSGSYALYTNGETLYIISDGSNWQIVQHRADTDWSSSVASTITAAGGNPTKGNSGVGTLDAIQWRRRGNMCVVRFRYQQTNATGAAAGSGNYQILIPGGIAADTTFHGSTTSTSMPDTVSYWLLSTSGGNTAAANSLNGGVYLYDSTHFCISGDYQASNTGIWGSSVLPFTVSAVVHMGATLEFSVAGWRP